MPSLPPTHLFDPRPRLAFSQCGETRLMLSGAEAAVGRAGHLGVTSSKRMLQRFAPDLRAAYGRM